MPTVTHATTTTITKTTRSTAITTTRTTTPQAIRPVLQATRAVLPAPTRTRTPDIPTTTSRITTTPPSEPLFPLFSKLPPEIRLQIWSQTLSTPRFIQVTYSPIYERFSSKASPPSALSVNNESRSHAVSQLLKIPGSVQPHLFTLSHLPPAPPIYFHPDIDVLYVICKDKHTLWNTIFNFPDEIKRAIKKLCILYTCQVQSIQHSLKAEAPVLSSMVGLEKVWVVQYMRPELNRPWGSDWVSGDLLDLVVKQGSGQEILLDDWSGLVREEEVKTKGAIYWVGGGLGVGMPIGRVMCWHGIKAKPSLSIRT